MNFSNFIFIWILSTSLEFIEAEKKYCDSNPCGRDFRCEEVDKGFKCVCNNGICKDKNFCTDVDCGADMLCKGLTDGYTCICNVGNCVLKGFCEPNPCAPNESCQPVKNGHECKCTLSSCYLIPDICKDVKCLRDDMTCIGYDHGYRCKSGPNKLTNNCLEKDVCKEDYNCENEVIDYKCKCLQNQCNVKKFCTSSPCKEGSQCIELFGGYRCEYNTDQSELDKMDSGDGNKPGSGSGSKPESGSGTKPGSGSGTKPGSGSSTKPGSGSGTKSGSKSGTNSGSVTGTNPGLVSKIDTNSGEYSAIFSSVIFFGIVILGCLF